MKLPYGTADFHKIRTQGYFYVDKTRYLEQLEQRAEKAEEKTERLEAKLRELGVFPG